VKEQHLYKVGVKDCLRLGVCGGEGTALAHAFVLKKEIAAAREGAGLQRRSRGQLAAAPQKRRHFRCLDVAADFAVFGAARL
jgi:hypothetical protein